VKKKWKRRKREVGSRDIYIYIYLKKKNGVTYLSSCLNNHFFHSCNNEITYINNVDNKLSDKSTIKMILFGFLLNWKVNVFIIWTYQK
jgi:hypothetical protein